MRRTCTRLLSNGLVLASPFDVPAPRALNQGLAILSDSAADVADPDVRGHTVVRGD